MIGRIRGVVLEKQPPDVLIDVNGVAYELQASMTTFYHLPEVNQDVVLYTHLAVREDAHQLYGFWSLQERTLFRNLLKVNGVGPKLALTILSSIDPDNFVRCVTENDTASLVRLPGVGKKTAERLIIEMRDRLAEWAKEIDLTAANQPEQVSGNMKGTKQDALSALVALGYKPPEAQRAVQKVYTDEVNREELIRLALQYLAKA